MWKIAGKLKFQWAFLEFSWLNSLSGNGHSVSGNGKTFNQQEASIISEVKFTAVIVGNPFSSV